MPHFVTLIRYTQQGISKIKDSPKRLQSLKAFTEAEYRKIISGLS